MTLARKARGPLGPLVMVWPGWRRQGCASPAAPPLTSANAVRGTASGAQRDLRPLGAGETSWGERLWLRILWEERQRHGPPRAPRDDPGPAACEPSRRRDRAAGRPWRGAVHQRRR